MAITKEKKQQIVADYVERLSSSQAVILADYRGMNVAAATALRVKLRDVEAGLQVVKNTLFRLALKQVGLPVPEESLQGTVAVSYCSGPVPAIVKALADFSRENEALQIRGAIYGQSVLDAAGAKALADLPPREVVLATLLGTVQGPLSSLVSIINAPLREMAYVIKARSEQAAAA